MRSISAAFATVLLVCLSVSGVLAQTSQDPLAPRTFTHTVRAQKTRHEPAATVTVAVARVDDNDVVGTPFGHHTREGLLSTEGDEDGFPKKLRADILEHLATVPFFSLLEREQINSIIREWDFAGTRYVDTAGKKPKIQLPDYIAKGYVTSGDEPCAASDDSPEALWGVADDKAYAYKVVLRFYDTRTSRIAAVACGRGDSYHAALARAVDYVNENSELFVKQ